MNELSQPGQPCEVLPFPLSRQVGRIRTTAAKYLAKPTGKSAENYWRQVTKAMEDGMRKNGIPADLAAVEIDEFWNAVDSEINRILNAEAG